jgi:ABC-2 type transport system ATP-binding protein
MKTRVIQDRPATPTAAEPVLAVTGLTKHYGPVDAVEQLTFSVRAGRIAGFLGPNGSGKTTTLRMLVGLVKPTAGSATINGVPYRELHRPQRQVGVMLDAAAHPARSARNHLRVLAAEARVPAERVDEVLELVDLTSAGHRKVGGFSLGMRQRIGLAGALIGDPAILVLDEPANGLDPEGIRWLRDFLRGLAAEGRTVLLSSHVLAEVAATVDDVVLIARGRLVTQAPLADLLARTGTPPLQVRTSSPAALTAVLSGPDVTVTPTGADTLTVVGLSAEAVADAAHAHGIVLYQLAASSTSLEETFFSLTAPAPGEVRA